MSWKKLIKSRKAMTGLETAIILIAFVVVAAAFAFVVLNMGFYTAQKSRTVISSGLGEASSAIEVDGSVIAQVSVDSDSQSNTNVTAIIIYIKLSVGKEAVELTTDKLVISYFNQEVAVDNAYNDNSTACVITEVVGDGDAILEEGEKFKVFLNLTAIVNNKSTYGVSDKTDLQIYPHPHDEIRIEIKPPIGAILTIERTIPAKVDTVTYLD